MDSYRSTVSKLRAQYRREFPEHIRRAANDAPPLTTSQLAFMRRCIRQRSEVVQ